MIGEIDIPSLVKRLCEYPKEMEWFEFKSNHVPPEKLGQTVSAIANVVAMMQRPNGYVIWGIRDGDHQISGTTFDPDTKKIQSDDLSHWLLSRLKPSTEFRFYKDTVDGKPIVVLAIPSAVYCPIRFDNEAYIRVGSHTRRLNDFPDKEKLLWRILDTRIFEKEVAIERVDHQGVLQLLNYESYFKFMKMNVPQDSLVILHQLEDEQFIRQRDDQNWDILNLGSLAFGRNLEDTDTLSRKPARIVRYSGSGRWHQSEEEELTDGYASGFAAIMDCVRRFTPKNETFNGGFRKQESRFPDVPVRELIANALIHQDLTARGAGPLVEIFEDRMEVLNPGAPLIDARLFISAPPKSRNEALSKLLRRFGICEERGIGWDRIVQEIEILQLPAPRVEVIHDSTRVTLYAARPLSTMSPAERIEAIYQHACLQYVNGAIVTNASIRKRFGIHQKNSSKASRFLAEALTAGVIVSSDSKAGKKFMKYLPHWAKDSTEQNMATQSDA